jgi:predicted SAM-dependent methyltransferase
MEGIVQVKLNLGSGERPKEGFINIDINPEHAPDIVRDLCRGIPFSDSTADEIHAFDFFEHLPKPADYIFVMNECHRVLEPGGLLTLEVPHMVTRPDWALGAPTHVRYFCRHSFDYFQDKHEQYIHNGRGYGILPWNVQVSEKMFGGILHVRMEPVK